MDQNPWQMERIIEGPIKTDLMCSCGGHVYYTKNEIRDDDEDMATEVNVLYCANCGLSMRSSKFDKNAEWLKEQWNKSVNGALKPQTDPVVHRLKLSDKFANAVLSGDKNFEIRENDRGFQKGDIVTFIVIDRSDFAVYHPLNYKKYVITYVLNGWGLKENYVVFGIKELAK